MLWVLIDIYCREEAIPMSTHNISYIFMAKQEKFQNF